MLTSLLKRLSSKLPPRTQQDLKRRHFQRDLRKGQFRTDEPEYALLGEWIRPGDWVIDVGANVGHYTVRLSELVGSTGRVLAFEPVPETFELLAANTVTSGARNISLINAALSANLSIMSMTMPNFSTGLRNYYMASLTPDEGNLKVLTVPLDTIPFPKPVTFVKIDVEGHELQALQGMRGILQRDKPILVVEGTDPAVRDLMNSFNYNYRDLANSPNRIFSPKQPHGRKPAEESQTD